MRAQAQKARHGAHGGVARASARSPSMSRRSRSVDSLARFCFSIVCLIGSKRGAPLSRGPGACVLYDHVLYDHVLYDHDVLYDHVLYGHVLPFLDTHPT